MTPRSALSLVALAAGLAGCALDVGTPRAYPCKLDGGAAQCPGGWRCGLEGTCHDPAVAAAYACAADPDCEGGWRCGTDGRCYDRADAGAVACRDGSDCRDGWRCGLEGLCHDRDAGAAYACRSDFDCERGWRCSPDGVCLDALGDALQRGSAPALSPQRLSPTLLSGPPSALAATPEFAVDGGTALTLSYVDGTSWVSVLYRPDAGVWVHAEPAPAGWTSIAANQNRAYALAPDGLHEVAFSETGEATGALWPGGGTRLKSSGPFVIALDGTRLWLHYADGGVNGPHELPRADGGEQSLYDVEFQGWNLHAAAEEGLFYAQAYTLLVEADGGLAAPVFRPDALLELPNDECSTVRDGGYSAVSLHRGANGQGSYGNPADVLALMATPLASPLAPASAIVATPNANPFAYSPGCLAGAFNGLALHPCEPCPAGETFLGLAAELGQIYDSTVGGQASWLRTRCRTTAGADRTYELFGGEKVGCTRTLVAGESTYYSDAATLRPLENQASALAGAHGQLWAVAATSDYPYAEQLHALTLDRVPGIVTGSGPALAAFSGELARLVPGLGLVNGGPWPFLDVPVAEVRGEGALVVTREQSADPIEPRRTLDHLRLRRGVQGAVLASGEGVGSVYPPPYQAQLTSSSDGASLAVVSSGDSIHVADLGVVDPDYGAPLVVKSSPQASADIRSFAIVPPGDLGGAPALVTLYALTAGGLFRVDAATLDAWFAERVDVPIGAWVEVWATNGRARLGYADGTVRSLPSRVLIAPPLPGGGAVTDFEQVCGDVFALGAAGLFRLLPPAAGEAMGSWHREAVEALLPGGADGLAGGRLYSADSELDLFTAHGATLRLSAGCAP